MFQRKILQSEMIKNEITTQKLCEIMKISRSTFSKKMNGKSEWNHSEIRVIQDVFGKDIMLCIFFGDMCA